MKTVADYIKLVEDGEAAATNMVSTGAIAMKDVPLGKVQKRKPVEEGEVPAEGEEHVNKPEDRCGTDPLAQVYAPDVNIGTDNGHMFHMKQAAQQNYS